MRILRLAKLHTLYVIGWGLIIWVAYTRKGGLKEFTVLHNLLIYPKVSFIHPGPPLKIQKMTYNQSLHLLRICFISWVLNLFIIYRWITNIRLLSYFCSLPLFLLLEHLFLRIQLMIHPFMIFKKGLNLF